jgi:hypothetical protein
VDVAELEPPVRRAGDVRLGAGAAGACRDPLILRVTWIADEGPYVPR